MNSKLASAAPGLIQSVSQALLPGLWAWVEVGEIAPSQCSKALLPQPNLLYVACTRARDHLLITSGDTCSEFVEDLK